MIGEGEEHGEDGQGTGSGGEADFEYGLTQAAAAFSELCLSCKSLMLRYLRRLRKLSGRERREWCARLHKGEEFFSKFFWKVLTVAERIPKKLVPQRAGKRCFLPMLGLGNAAKPSRRGETTRFPDASKRPSRPT
jgi:hypothetical protein